MKYLKEIYAYREMIFSLVRKDLRGRYKGSLLGFFWTFLNPLLQLIVYTLVFSSIMRMGIDRYYLFLFVALIPWMFFSTSVAGGANCIIAQLSLVTKIYFPREVIPIAHVTAAFVNMLYSFIIVFIVVAFSGVDIQLQALLYLPVIMIIQYILALGIAMTVSAITVYFRDFEHILGIIMMAWMYMTPVIYPINLVPEKYMHLFMLNPMTPITIAYREILYYGTVPHMSTVAQAGGLGIILLLIGLIVFNKLKRHFAEEL
jgi:ABC-2 type transport system permease protein